MITGRTQLMKALGVSRDNLGLGVALGMPVEENLMLSAMGVLGSGGAPVPPAPQPFNIGAVQKVA